MSERARFKLYRAHMRVQDNPGMRAFAVVIDKAEAASKYAGSRVAPDIAWEYLLQRLERTFRTSEVMVVHDEGDPITIHKRARKARRAGTAGSSFGTDLLNVPFRNLLDDRVSRISRQSYFIQLADLNAYAASRRLYPTPPRRDKVVPQRMWDFLVTHRNAASFALTSAREAVLPAPFQLDSDFVDCCSDFFAVAHDLRPRVADPRGVAGALGTLEFPHDRRLGVRAASTFSCAALNCGGGARAPNSATAARLS